MVLRSKGRFAAVEVKAGETAHQAIGSLMRLAHEQGKVFAVLELYDTFKINRTTFVRVRSELDVKEMKGNLLQSGRGVVVRQDADIRYGVFLVDGSKGNYSASAMHGMPRISEHKSYRGTKDKFWARQFE